jgi:HlyD family secretion protein
MTWLHGILAWLGGTLVALAAAMGLGGGGPLEVQGYVEGEYVYVGTPVAGRLETLDVARGARVAAGTPLFQLDRSSEQPASDDAAARLARAEYERDQARVAELQAELETAQLGARADEIEAAEAEVEAARAQLAQAEWRLDELSQAAPQAGLVIDTLYRPGEWVAAGAPVVQMLPPENIKLRFFVPEPQLGAIQVGALVEVRCDACAPGLTAEIRYIAPEAEYTPPVIYSREMRAKLVYLVEARPRQPDALRPGQPADVTIAAVPTS